MVDTIARDTTTSANLGVGLSASSFIDQNDLNGNLVDSDYFRVNLTAGHTYRFTGNANVSFADTLDALFMRIRDSIGNVLVPDISSDSATPFFTFTPNSSGTYYLAVSAGGTGAFQDKTGDYAVTLSDITPPPQTPDLVASLSSVSSTSALAGSSINVNYTISNNGAAAAANSFGLVFISPDATFGDANDIALNAESLPPTGSLGSGGSMAQSQTVALPNFLSAGNYFIAVKADGLSTVSESNEGNNFSATQAITITNPTPLPFVTIADASVGEGGTLNFAVSLDKVWTTDVVVNFNVTGGSATSGSDYFAPGSSSVTIHAGSLSANASINTTNDGVAESNETVTLQIFGPLGANLGSKTTATGTIIDGGGGVFTVTPETTSVNENLPGFIDFTVSRTASTATESVFFSTILNGGANTSDYTSIGNRQLTFAPSATTSSQTVRVFITPDAEVEPNQTFGVIIQRTSNPDPNVFLDRSFFTIVNDDIPSTPTSQLSISPSNVTRDENAGGDFTDYTFTVTRTGDATQAVTVNWSATGSGAAPATASDFQGSLLPSGSLTIAAGGSGQGTIIVRAANDSIPEQTEAFLVSITNPTPGVTITSPAATGVIQNDDKSAATIFGQNGQLNVFATLASAAYHQHDFEPRGDRINDVPTDNNESSYNSLASMGLVLLQPGEIGLVAPTAGASYRTGLAEGIYTNGNAAALLARASDSLFISFRGTNDNDGEGLLDFDTPDKGHWFGKSDHYALFQQALVGAIKNYLNAHPEINNVYVTGHSLGAAMAQHYLQDPNAVPATGVNFQAITFANPGFGAGLDGNDPRITNIYADNDAIRTAGFVARVLGEKIILDDGFQEFGLSGDFSFYGTL